MDSESVFYRKKVSDIGLQKNRYHDSGHVGTFVELNVIHQYVITSVRNHVS